MAISDEELAVLFTEDNAHKVFVVRFVDGSTEELMDCQVWSDTKECTATIVRPGAGSRHSRGQGISFKLDDVAEVQISERGFDYYR